jgi:hypothetical protein
MGYIDLYIEDHSVRSPFPGALVGLNGYLIPPEAQDSSPQFWVIGPTNLKHVTRLWKLHQMARLHAISSLRGIAVSHVPHPSPDACMGPEYEIHHAD